MRELRAGPLSCLLDGIDLRYVCNGDAELVRRLFVAVRDAAWGTVAPQIRDLEVEDGGDSFRVSFDALHESGELRFHWRGLLAGSADGVLECRMDGKAETDFRFCRIGFCVLHPRELAGGRYRAHGPNGEIEDTLPETIGVQRFADGTLWPLFPSYDRIELGGARFEFEGDLFEMEDQRNWTDASFKTYSTPITLGWPHDAAAGQAIVQSVRLSVDGRARSRATQEATRIELGAQPLGRVPAFGLGMATDGGRLDAHEAELIAALRPAHLRVDLAGDTWRGELARATEAARQVNAALELALFLGEDALDALADALPEDVEIARVLVIRDGEQVTDLQWARAVRERVAVPVAVGTDGWFADLNRDRPEPDGVDALVYSISATVHADDDISVLETPAAQGDTVRSARGFAGDRKIVVSAVTIRPRSWPFGDAADPRGLPFQVDQRQCALAGAAWAAASAKHLAEARADSVTYFETAGWRGVLERADGPPDPDRFSSRPGAAFPIYHVLADLGEWRGSGEVVPVASSAPLVVEALGVRNHGRLHLLVANLTPHLQRCVLDGLAGKRISARVLDEHSYLRAGDQPLAFRVERDDAPSAELELAPYAVARIDA
jgi:D-apionolactonase